MRARAATFGPLLERRGGIKAGDLEALAALYQRAVRYRRSAVARHARSPGDAGEAQRKREAKAQARLLRSAAPITATDPAGRYLSGCGLSLDQARGAGLRFHPGAPVTVDGETRGLPALLAPVRTPGGKRAAAVHCFHLTPEGRPARIERQTHG